MEIWSRIRAVFADDRLDANLIGFYGGVVVIFIVSLVLRRLLLRSGHRLARWTGVQWLGAVSEEACRHVRGLLFWLTLLAMAVTGVAGVVYHMAGRDLRDDAALWYSRLTVEELFQLGINLGLLCVVGVVTWFAGWAIRRIRPKLEAHGQACVGCTANQLIQFLLLLPRKWRQHVIDTTT